MTQKELLAKCSERDQAFYDFFHRDLDIKAFTELIDPDQVPYITLVDYHLVATSTAVYLHNFTLEARYQEDAYKFYKYLRDNIFEPGTITDYCISQVSDQDFYILTITVN